MPATPRKIEEIFALDTTRDERAAARLLQEAEGVECPVLMDSQMLENQAPPAWYMERFLQENSLTILFGPPKSGKTFLALEWAHALALGRPWLGFQTIPIRVLYCSAEGNQTLGERTKALRQQRKWDQPDSLRFLPGVRQLFYKQRHKPSALLELVVAIAEFKPHLVVIDTLARHTPGSNVADNADMSMMIKTVDELREAFGCSFLMIHHTRREGSDYLGATALFGAADMMVKVQPTDSEGFMLHATAKDLDDYTPPWSFQIVPVADKPGWATFEAGNLLGDRQDALIEVLQEQPGLTATELQVAVWGKPGKNVYSVLAKLEERGLVSRSKKKGGSDRWFVQENDDF